MEALGIPLVAVIICSLILVAFLSVGLITFLIKVGVIVREAQRPPHLDSGNYRLDQGREVDSNDRRSS